MYDNDAGGSGHRGRRRAQLLRAGLLAAALALLERRSGSGQAVSW